MAKKANIADVSQVGRPSEEQQAESRREINAGTESLRYPDGVGKGVSDCGDAIEIQIAVERNIIKHVSYKVDGCAYTLVSAQAAVALIRGKSLQEAKKAAKPENIDNALGGLPEHNKHCTEIAAKAALEAIRHALVGVRDPWKKLYRKW